MADFCKYCGRLLNSEVQCPKCYKEPTIQIEYDEEFPEPEESLFERATMPLTELTGEDDFVDLKLRDLFSKVFKRHTLDESEEIFIAGTKNTTPDVSSLSSSWPKPWLFSRIFLMFFITFVSLYICYELFDNLNALPGMIFIGAIAVPISLLVFFMEVNVPRNISFYEVLKVFFIGGGSSLVVALVLYMYFTPGEPLGYFDAIIVGFVEEVAKLLVVAHFIKRNPEANYVLNGILLGAAVGAGFATFETAGYILNSGLSDGGSVMMLVMLLRGLLAPGGHVAWAAIAGGALLLAKRDRMLSIKHYFDYRFIIFFWLAIAMHAIWDMPIYISDIIPVVQIVMTLFAWVILFVLMSAGLKEVSRKSLEAYISEQDQNSVLF